MYLSIFLETHTSDSSLPGVEAGESEAAALGPGEWHLASDVWVSVAVLVEGPPKK